MKGFVRVLGGLAVAAGWIWFWHTLGPSQLQSSTFYIFPAIAAFSVVVWMFDRVYEFFGWYT